MPRKYIFLLSGLLAVLLAGLGVYLWLKKDPITQAWSAIPSHAIAVVEVEQTSQSLADWQKSAVHQSIGSLPYFQMLTERLAFIRQYPEVEGLLKKKMLASLHVTTQSDFDYIFFIPLTSTEEGALQEVTQRLYQNKDFRATTHTYSGHTITEITHQATSQTFSFLLYKNVFIGSYTSFLVEDAIRTLSQGFVFSKGQWLRWQQPEQKQGLNVYLNLPALPQLVQVVTGKKANTGFLLEGGQFASFSVNQKDNALILEGKTYVSAQEEAKEYLHIFEGQSASAMQCVSLLPAQSAVVYHWSFSDASSFLQKKREYDEAHGNAKNTTPLPDWVGNEMALILVESLQEEPHRLLVVQAAKPKQANQALKHESETHAAANRESYRGFTIRKIDIRNFPAALFGEEMNGFEECFYTVVKNFVVFGNSMQAVKTLLDDHATGQHWVAPKNKSLTSFFIEVNIERAWSILQQHASTHWQSLLQQYSKELKSFQKLTLSLSPPQDQVFETRLVLQNQTTPVGANIQNRYFSSWHATVDTLISLPPMLVRNHVDQSRELLTQDAANQLYLVNQKGKVLWKVAINGAVYSDIFQIDYLKNNKLQYLFATKHAINLIDRNGNGVAPFSLPFHAATPLHTLTVIDYENNLDYRFIASDLLGNLYMYDKSGTLVEGWKPLPTGYRLQCAPKHIHLQNKDYFVVLQANGKLTVLNRRGQPYAGFPIDLNIRTESPFLIEEGHSPAETQIMVVSENGEVVQVNLLGDVTSRKQLSHTTGDNTFYLCAEPQQRDWIIYRTDSRSIGILDKNGSLLFETVSHPTGKQYVQYHNFGSGLRVVSVTYAATKQTFLYTLNGTLIGNEAFSNQLPIALMYSDIYDKLLIHSVMARKVEARTVKVR